MKKLSLQIIVFVFLCAIGANLNAQNIYTFAGISGPPGYTGDGGSAILATMNNPRGVATDASGNVYFCDAGNHVIRKVSASGTITTIAGTGTPGYTGDGGPASIAELANPYGIAVDASGNIYISDVGNYVVRKINTSGVISTFAGTGMTGYSGDGGAASAAELGYPIGLAVSASGNVYIADALNYVVRVVNTSGIISTMAGDNSAGYSGDGGPATNAMLGGPVGLALDASGNLYISDFADNVVRKVTSAGIISTYAGDTVVGYSGDGGAATSAELSAPYGLAIDGSGNLYIADNGNERVRKVNTSGVISTFAGNGTAGYYGDGAAAILAELRNPQGVAIDPSNNLYITDNRNEVIRRVGAPVRGITITSATGDTVCAGTPAHFSATVFVDATPHYQWQVNGVSAGTDSSGFTDVTPHTGDVIDCILDSAGIELAISETIIVDSFPDASIILGPPTICVGSSVMLRDSTTDTARGFGGGMWENRDTTVASLRRPSLVTGLTTGTDTILFVNTNECGSSVAALVITVIPSTYGPISGPSQVCERDSAIYTDPTTGGMWNIAGGGGGFGGGGNTIDPGTGQFVAGRRPGVAIIVYGMPGCFVSDTVIVVPAPRVSPITGPTGVYDGLTITLVDTTTGGVWSSANTGIATVDGSSGVVTGVSSGPVGITYSVTNAAGCTAYRIDTINVYGTNGVKNIQNNASFGVFPNPASGSLFVKWNSIVPGNGNVVISDVTGREVFKSEIGFNTPNGQAPVDVSSLKPGVYMIAVKSESGYYCSKLILE